MTTLKYILNCKLSGVQIGVLEYQVVAGHMPYLSHWDNMTALHPLFSLPRGKLLAFARNEWNRLSKSVLDEVATDAETQMLQVCFLAVLHSLESVKQDVPSLPPIHLVQANMQSLFKIAYWKHYLDSKRFSFPEYKINKINANYKFDNIHHYIDTCFKIKEDYEEGVDDFAEQEKIAAAEKALKALRNNWASPTSNKQLWAWVKAHMPKKHEADASNWMQSIFLGKEQTILAYDKDELELMEHIILAECPPGTGVLAAVMARMEAIFKIHSDHKEAFTVDFADYEDSEPLATLRAASKTPDSIVAPRPQDFASKALYIRANALFYLQQRAIEAKTTGAKVPDLTPVKPLEDAPF